MEINEKRVLPSQESMRAERAESEHEKVTMEKLFIDYLDRKYQQGYGLEFLENNPDAFYYQLAKFSEGGKRRKL